uniref:Sushi domain-containing protein n=1 Tax=Panagrolaimus sp. PS1159 TaxID=55785 RepID=A0AC35F6X8_9BILA
MRGETAVRICQENGKWSTPEMYCKLPICLITEAIIENGKLDIPNGLYIVANSSTNVTCFEGYDLIENNNLAYCNSEGKWNETLLPKCEFSNCTNFTCGNGIARQVDGANICRCECHYGYWQNYNSSGPCIDMNECAMNYSLCGYDTTCKNSIGNYTCEQNTPDDYYTIYNYTEMKYKEFPELPFILSDISLVRKRCDKIDTINAVWQPAKSLRLVGEIVDIYCTQSQTLLTVQCQINSMWNDTIYCPSGEALTCSPPVIEGLSLSPQLDKYILGQHVEFSCQDSDRILIGPSYTVCALLNNNTAGFVATPICKKKQCSEIVLDPNRHLQFVQETKDFSKGVTIQLKYTSDITSTKINYSPGEKISFQCIQPHYVLSDASDVFCGNTKSGANEAAQLKNDMITKNFWNQQRRQPRQAFFEDNNYGKILDLLQPHRESIFDSSKDTLRSWDKNNDWIYTNDGWKYSSNSRNNNNFLISPMIRVQFDTGTINVLAENMNPECSVEISYFTANYLI